MGGLDLCTNVTKRHPSANVDPNVRTPKQTQENGKDFIFSAEKMFKSGRSKGQNSKINVMFQLQFQATQVPKMKGKGLMIALIPAETGKPIAKLERTPVVDGSCTWAEPIYELVKLVKHQKTETYKEKIYYFNVQTGSSKSGFVGEVGVDFANFAETTEPFQLSLPLTTSSSGAILHVFIQKMQRKDESRETDENESLQSESVRSRNQASDCSENGNTNAESKNIVKQRSITDWSLGSLSDRSMADLLNSPEENRSKDEAQTLKSEVTRLERQAELAELELESLRKQISKENRRSQDLSTKIDELEGQCDELNKLKVELVKDFERKMKEKDKEISSLSEDIESIYAELELEKKEKEELKIHIEDVSLDYRFLLQENDDISSKSLTTTREYELQVKRLEEKIMNQAAEFKTHIKRLETELEKQGLDFEDDVQDLMKAKIEQEERIVQAEEALKKSTLTNAAIVDKCNQEILLLTDAHRQEIQKLYDQIDQMSLELESCKKIEENNSEWVREKETLLAEFDSLKKESTSLVSEKNVMIRTLKSELKVLRGDHNERLLVIDNLQKEVSRLDQENRNLLKKSKVACDVTTSKDDENKSILKSEKRCSEQKLLSEISSLDERNKQMENELKEMQEKYSEVSLRFAEVEGERQQLVMALRNLRNGKK
ncbi:hypothetical protein R6Q57_002342 [Mikania cordata]